MYSEYAIGALQSAMSALDRLRRQGGAPGKGEHSDFCERLAAQVVERRGARRMSQREMAELCATTQSAIARLESGGRPPRIDTLLRVAEALDCELVVELRPRTTTGRDA